MTISIDWGEWQWNAWEEGLVGFSDEIRAFLVENRERFGITFEEGCDAFERVLSRHLPRVVVSTQDFHKVVEFSKYFTITGILNEGRESGQTWSKHPRPELMVPYAAPTNEIEKRVAEIWQSLLGIEAVGIQDNFFELGGHSLMAMQVISQLGQMFQIHLPLSTVLMAPTIAELAIAVEMAIIEELEGLAEEEASSDEDIE